MKTKSDFFKKRTMYFAMILFIAIGYFQTIPQAIAQKIEADEYVTYKGLVIDINSRKSLEFATLTVNETNISTITNSDGKFLLKVPKDLTDKSVTVSYLGYHNKVILLTKLSTENTTIKLVASIEKLPEISIISKDPDFIVRKVMENKRKNYFQDPVIMKAFYRESIKKRRTYASLSEAVVEIYKQPYQSKGYDYVKLNRARKSTDYRKIDTLVIKLQGGPYNNINIDLIKNRDMFFNEDIFEKYKFTFEKVISINNRMAYVINFNPYKYIDEPLYFGKLYIDVNTYALSKAIFSLNLENPKKASKYFVKKKPAKADVTPTIASYRVDYRVKDGKWYFGYSRIELTFKINWKKKLFNSLYNITIEMAVTDWKLNADKDSLKNREKLKTNVILNDKASGFSNPEFWGEYNVIEPDKSIENAIKKIQRQLNKKG
ncbi:MAG: carboxypeptidase-like regulatory domain-containing protein [Flavobacteriaceae bacterium]|nr:carboxypeptidase-like regulatory domain-containing protein [Flavobacteriaceae bacterium]